MSTQSLPSNSEIAGVLSKIADNLELLEENPIKIREYRTGAKNICSSDKKAANLVKAGDGLTMKTIPGAGDALVNISIEYVQNGIEDEVMAVTETKGALKGKRVVRGREKECEEFYLHN